MKFSIIVPVYNVAEYLPYCLDSIVQQSCQDFEVIMIDDGSTDGSSEICDCYAEHYENFICIHQENRGLSGARNTGLGIAKGEWIAFIDSDDWVEKDMFEWLSKYIAREDAELYCFNMKKIYPDQKEEKVLYTVENITLNFRSEEERFKYYRDYFMQYKIGWEACNRIFKRQIVDENKMRFADTDKVYAEDYLFTFVYLLKISKVCCLCHIFYNYRQRENSLLHRKDSVIAAECLKKWAVLAYAEVCDFEMKYFKRHFEELYFILIQFHIQYTLSDLPIEDAKKVLSDHFVDRKENKWIRKIKKDKTYMTKKGTRPWI